MSRREDLLSLAGGAIGGAAAITGLWLTRRCYRQPITGAKPYNQGDAVVTSISNLKGAKP